MSAVGGNKSFTVRCVALVLTLCAPLSGVAQEATPVTTELEEVIVTGDDSLLQLRSLMWKAEKKAYDTFNKFNDEKRFNITCHEQKPTGTRIIQQLCQAEFVRKANGQHGRDNYYDLRDLLDPWTMPGISSRQSQPLVFEIGRQLDDYRNKIKQVAEENPEFLQAIIEYSKIREQYEAETSTSRNND